MKTVVANKLVPGMLILGQFHVTGVECRLATTDSRRCISVSAVSIIDSVGYDNGCAVRFEYCLSSKVAVSL